MLTSATTFMLVFGDIRDVQQAHIWLAGSVYGRNWQHAHSWAAWLIALLSLAILSARQLKILAFGVSPRAYIELMKPRIVSRLVFTCVTSMIVAVDSFPPVDLLALPILGGVLSAGGASALNQYLNRELDAKMARTDRRPIPSGRVSAGQALAFGVALDLSSALACRALIHWHRRSRCDAASAAFGSAVSL